MARKTWSGMRLRPRCIFRTVSVACVQTSSCTSVVHYCMRHTRSLLSVGPIAHLHHGRTCSFLCAAMSFVGRRQFDLEFVQRGNRKREEGQVWRGVLEAAVRTFCTVHNCVIRHPVRAGKWHDHQVFPRLLSRSSLRGPAPLRHQLRAGGAASSYRRRFPGGSTRLFQIRQGRPLLPFKAHVTATQPQIAKERHLSLAMLRHCNTMRESTKPWRLTDPRVTPIVSH